MEGYIQSSPTLSCTPMAEPPPKVIRRTAVYHPCVWGDYFLSHAVEFEAMDASTDERHKELEEEVRKTMVAASETPSVQLKLIDQIERLGIAYRFKTEIDKALEKLYENYDHAKDEDVDDLHTTTLLFRLLRQHGHPISCDAFRKLKDKEGNFKESILADAQGMLSLFEATHVRVHGEKILDEALDFTVSRLQSMIPSLTDALASQVVHALSNPIHKALTRIEAQKQISIFHEHNLCHDEQLLEFAKLDFNLLQKVHQREIVGIVRWSKDLDYVNKMPFARDRVVECYLWALGVYFEPQYWLGRKILTYILHIITYVDDVYDSYGTYEELVLFTNAIQRWDLGAAENLPDYMKEFYQTILRVFCEMEEELASSEKQDCAYYIKAEFIKLAEGYFDEVKWTNEERIPKMDEYMKVALVTGTYGLLAAAAFAGMENEFVTKDVFTWVFGEPLILKASSVVCRLTDDWVGREFERGIVSAVECYMAQYGTSKGEACTILKEQVSGAWKDMNHECIFPTVFPLPLLVRIVNLARVIDLLYREEDGFTISNTRTKGLITSILVEPVVMFTNEIL